MEEGLVDGLIKGDPVAYEKFVRAYADKLYRFIVRLVGKGAVEDLIQEVYMKLINNIKRFRSGNFDAWVFKIARNICIDYIRRSPKERLFALADEFTVHETPSMRLEKEEQSALLKKAIESLPIEQKEVFLLREEAGLSFKDIANIQGVSINTVLGRMHYALNNLRKILKGYLL